MRYRFPEVYWGFPVESQYTDLGLLAGLREDDQATMHLPVYGRDCLLRSHL